MAYDALMGARTKGRRRIVVQGEVFYWSVHDEDLNTIHLVSADKRLILRYGAGWQGALPPGERYVDVMGPRFAGLPGGCGGWYRVLAPDWENESFSRHFVRKLVLWALESKQEVVFKRLPHGYSTDLVTAAPWGPGLPTFTSSPGEPQVHRQPAGQAS